MAAKSKARKAARRQERADNFRKRVPTQPDGEPQGKHLTGFKGTKTNVACFCGGCNPAAKENRGKVIYR